MSGVKPWSPIPWFDAPPGQLRYDWHCKIVRHCKKFHTLAKRISSSLTVSMSRNDIKCKCMCNFLLGNSASKGCLNLLFSCDQAALWMVLSVRPSHLFDYVPIIVSSWNFQELLPMTEVTSMQKVKVTEVTTQLNRFGTVTPVWIHKWWWNDAYSLIMLRRGALLFFKVIRQISRSHGSKNRRIWPRLGVSGL